MGERIWASQERGLNQDYWNEYSAILQFLEEVGESDFWDQLASRYMERNNNGKGKEIISEYSLCFPGNTSKEISELDAFARELNTLYNGGDPADPEAFKALFKKAAKRTHEILYGS